MKDFCEFGLWGMESTSLENSAQESCCSKQRSSHCPWNSSSNRPSASPSNSLENSLFRHFFADVSLLFSFHKIHSHITVSTNLLKSFKWFEWWVSIQHKMLIGSSQVSSSEICWFWIRSLWSLSVRFLTSQAVRKTPILWRCVPWNCEVCGNVFSANTE